MRLLRFQVDEEVKIGSLIGTRVIDLEKGRQLLSESGDNRFRELEVLRGGFQHILLHYGWTFSLLRSLEDSIRELVIHDNSLEESTELFYKEKDIVYKSLFPDHNRILTCRGLNPNTLRTQSAFRLPVIPVGDWRSRNKLIAHKEPFILPKTVWAQSSIMGILYFSDNCIISGIFDGKPCMCTAMIAFVLLVIFLSISFGSILKVSGSMSTKTGIAL